jgi:Ca2+-binding RTX toxin-like protein
VIDGDIVLGDGDDRLHNSGLIAGRLLGGGGDDRIVGGDLNELIVGGSGHDVLTGGLGSDLFFFDGVADSAPVRAHADVIRDFDKPSGDAIVLRGFDADALQGGIQQFRFVGEAAFSGSAGELRCDLLRHGGVVISADVDGDAQADFALVVRGDIHAVSDLQFNL